MLIHLFLRFFFFLTFVFISQKYGATVSHEPREAQIILVDPSTISGRRFIRDWGQDSNKVVLSSIWVRKSIEAGYPLLANDQWGDCLAIDDGLPIGSGDEEEDNVPKSVYLFRSVTHIH